MFVAPPISVPPVVLAVVLLYHWYVSPTPAAVTEIGVNVPLIHTVCVAVLCAVIAVAGFTVIVAEPLKLIVQLGGLWNPTLTMLYTKVPAAVVGC